MDWWEGADFSGNRRHGTEALNRQRPRASIRKKISLFCRYIWDKINDLFDICNEWKASPTKNHVKFQFMEILVSSWKPPTLYCSLPPRLQTRGGSLTRLVRKTSCFSRFHNIVKSLVNPLSAKSRMSGSGSSTIP